MTLQGADGLRRRLDAIGGIFDAVYPRWQDATVRAARPLIPVRTGESQRSLRPGRITPRSAGVIGNATLNFIDAGSRAHDITSKSGVLAFDQGGLPVFRKKVHKPPIAARPFKRAAALKGLEQVDVPQEIVRLWDKAA